MMNYHATSCNADGSANNNHQTLSPNSANINTSNKQDPDQHHHQQHQQQHHHQTQNLQADQNQDHQEQQHQQAINNSGDTTIVSLGGESSDCNAINKIPNSYKYPLLKKYYNFGPWIGRNRKAICLGCTLQTSSSQPDRLLKHLNRCTALTEADKIAVQDLMNERTANKRKKPSQPGHSMRSRNVDLNNDNTTEYYGDGSGEGYLLPASGLKKMRRDPSDRVGRIDESLTRFIIRCKIPLKAIQSQEFADFVKSLDSDYRVPNHEIITTVLIPSMLELV